LVLTETVETDDWLSFISQITVKKGGVTMLKGIGTLAAYRSAFHDAWVHAVTMENQRRPEGMKEKIQVYFTAIAKRDAQERRDGKRKQKVIS
jgi:hypothetical protein